MFKLSAKHAVASEGGCSRFGFSILSITINTHTADSVCALFQYLKPTLMLCQKYQMKSKLQSNKSQKVAKSHRIGNKHLWQNLSIFFFPDPSGISASVRHALKLCTAPSTIDTNANSQIPIHVYKYTNVLSSALRFLQSTQKTFPSWAHCTFYKASEAVRQCQLKLTKYVTTCDCWWSFQEKWAGWIGWNCVHFNWSVIHSVYLSHLCYSSLNYKYANC